MGAIPTTLATAADYQSWNHNVPGPEGIDTYLEAVTPIIFEATQNARYAVDSDGVATDPDIKTAMMTATCIQASAWVKLKIDPDLGGVIDAKIATSKSIAGASITIAGAADAAAARAAAVNGPVPAARRILAQHGLIVGWPHGR